MAGRVLIVAGLLWLPCLALGQGPSPTAPSARLLLPGSQPTAITPQSSPTSAPTLPTPTATSPIWPNEQFAHPALHPDQAFEPNNGGCDGDCHSCRQAWCTAEFFIGKGQNLPLVDRRYIYGWQVGGGVWFEEDRRLGIDTNLFSAHGAWRQVPGPYLIDSPITLTTFDANLRMELFTIEKLRIDGLLGYRYLQLHERYFAGTTVTVLDLADRNHVNAGQIGLVADYRHGPYFAEAIGKLAIGRTSEDVDFGSLRTTEHDVCVIPQGSLRLGYQFGESFWGTVSYTAIYLTNTERPGQKDSNYFLHGLTVGFEKRF